MENDQDTRASRMQSIRPARDMRSGKMSPALCTEIMGLTLKLCLRRSQKPKFQFLHLENGQTPDWYEASELMSLGACITPNILEQHSDAAESSLSQILQEKVPEKYSLSPKACAGTLRRAERRGKVLPSMLLEALTEGSKSSTIREEAA